MDLKYTTIERNKGIATVRFDRNEKLNAFNQDLVLELTDVARSFHDDIEKHSCPFAIARFDGRWLMGPDGLLGRRRSRPAAPLKPCPHFSCDFHFVIAVQR